MIQELFASVNSFASKYLFWVDSPQITKIDIVEIIIISFLIYNILIWIKRTRAWNLLKGIIVVVVFILMAAIFQMNTILWIAGKTINVAVIAIIIVFQPELRRALEMLGRKNFLTALFSFDSQKNQERFSERVTNELVKATYEMAKVKTGALIVVEQDVVLGESATLTTASQMTTEIRRESSLRPGLFARCFIIFRNMLHPPFPDPEPGHIHCASPDKIQLPFQIFRIHIPIQLPSDCNGHILPMKWRRLRRAH